jgi:hypothetical protein
MDPSVAAFSGDFLSPNFEIHPYQFRSERDLRVVFWRIFDLHEVVKARIFIDAIGAGDEPRWSRGITVEMLMDGARRYVDDVAGLPFVVLDLDLRLPLVSVGNFDVAVLMQVVAMAFDDRAGSPAM